MQDRAVDLVHHQVLGANELLERKLVLLLEVLDRLRGQRILKAGRAPSELGMVA